MRNEKSLKSFNENKNKNDFKVLKMSIIYF